MTLRVYRVALRKQFPELASDLLDHVAGT